MEHNGTCAKMERTFGFRFVNLCWNSMSGSSVPAMPSFEALLDIFATMPYARHSVSHMLHYMKSQLACVACVTCVLPLSLESWHATRTNLTKKTCRAVREMWDFPQCISKHLYLPWPVSPSNERSQQHPLLDLGSMLQHATEQSLQRSSSHLIELADSIWFQ